MKNLKFAHHPPSSAKWTLGAVLVVLLCCLLAGCSTENPANITAPASVDQGSAKAVGAGEFVLEAKYDYIMSYPGGGGIFVLRLDPAEGFTGDVELSLSATKMLNAELGTTVVNAASPVAEITISPNRRIPIGSHTMSVTAVNDTGPYTIDLVVDVKDWGGGTDPVARQKQTEFISWLKAEHPEIGNLNKVNWASYATYPGILIVGHQTFLSAEWEFRVCYHVMIPPYDWSKMMIRPRGEWDGTLAAVKEWNEPAQDYLFSEIPVEDYPLIYDY